MNINTKRLIKLIQDNSLILLGGLFIAFSLIACSSEGPRTIRYGQDQCIHCKMTVSDARFGTQIVTKKGRAYNFDDLQCMVAYVKGGDIAEEDIAEYYLPDYANNHKLLPASEVMLLKSESLKSPMRGDIAAFKNKDDLEEAKKIHGGEELSWKDLWE